MQMDRLGFQTLGLHPPCATSIPLLPHRRRRWVPPRSFHPCTTTSLTLRPKEHTGGCRPRFPLAHFSPTRGRGYAASASCLRQSVPDDSTRPLARPTTCVEPRKTGYACVTADVFVTNFGVWPIRLSHVAASASHPSEAFRPPFEDPTEFAALYTPDPFSSCTERTPPESFPSLQSHLHHQRLEKYGQRASPFFRVQKTSTAFSCRLGTCHHSVQKYYEARSSKTASCAVTE
jgi:hypothetical protein